VRLKQDKEQGEQETGEQVKGGAVSTPLAALPPRRDNPIRQGKGLQGACEPKDYRKPPRGLKSFFRGLFGSLFDYQ